MPLLVVACGGTISSVPRGAGGAVPTLTAQDLLADLAHGLDPGEVEAVTASTLASSAMTLDDAIALHSLLSAWAAAHPVDGGIVVTHGTDTLEEVAFAVDLLWRHEVPVVFTGAMRHAGLPSSDGPANLRAAAVTARTPASRGAGVLVVLDDRVHLASAVRKTHTSALGTFVSPALGPVGYLAEGRARVLLHRTRPPALAPPVRPAAQHPVALVALPLGEDGRLLDAVPDAGYAGVVVEALGGGHVHPACVDRLERLALRLPVVLASRTGAGDVLTRTYGFSGSEVDLLARGLVPAGALDAAKARVLLTLVLAGGAGADAVPAAFARHG